MEPVTSTLLALSDPGASTLLALSDRGAGVPLRELALVGLTAAIVTYFATGGVRVLAIRLGAVAYPRERDVHLRPTARMGGLAMYLGVVTAVFLASQLPALTRGFIYSSGLPAVVIAGGLIMGIGLIDDRWGLDALTKFAGQITAASVLVTMGVAWSVLYIPFGGIGTIVLDQASSILLTLALTVSVVNAMNFVDGLDGLAAGLGLITALAICIFSVGLLRDHGGGADLAERLRRPRRLRPALAVSLGGGGGLRAGPGHAVGHRATDPGRPQSVQSRQDAPAPPTAPDRALTSPRRAADLLVGGHRRTWCGEHHLLRPPLHRGGHAGCDRGGTRGHGDPSAAPR